MLLSMATFIAIGCLVYWVLGGRQKKKKTKTHKTKPKIKKPIPRLENKPPQCLKEFKVSPMNIDEEPGKGHEAMINTVFNLSCVCGHDHFNVLGHYIKSIEPGQDPLHFTDPISLECDSCGHSNELIDTQEHGYNAKLGRVSGGSSRDGNQDPFSCKSCGPRSLEVIARFEYKPDLLQGDLGDFHGREQDLFSWCTLLGRCTHCGELLTIVELECA